MSKSKKEVKLKDSKEAINQEDIVDGKKEKPKGKLSGFKKGMTVAVKYPKGYKFKKHFKEGRIIENIPEFLYNRLNSLGIIKEVK